MGDVNLSRPMNAMGSPDKFSVISAFGAADTNKTFIHSGRARIWDVFVKVANWTNAVTLTFTIKDSAGNSLFTQAAIARNATTRLTSVKDVPLVGDTTFDLTLSGAPGAGGGDITSLIYVY